MKKYQYSGISENKECEGHADSVYEARQKIREALKGEKIDWKNNVTIIKVG